MILTAVVLFMCVRVGDLAPLLIDHDALQSSAQKFFYPGYQQSYLPSPYQQTPYITSPYAYQTLPHQSIQSLQDNILLKQFPGALPFLPIHINIPDLLQSIIRGLQMVFGTNLPIIGNPTIVTPNMAHDTMTSLGMYNNLKYGQFIPIIILIPQNGNPATLSSYDTVELKT